MRSPHHNPSRPASHLRRSLRVHGHERALHPTPSRPAPGAQRGAILVISLLLLLVLTIIGVTAMTMTRMQERMAGNTRDLNLGFQGAEAALRNGEGFIAAQAARPATCNTNSCNFRQYDPTVAEDATALTDIRTGDNTWWTTAGNAMQYQANGDYSTLTQDMSQLAHDPHFVIQHIGFVPDSLTVGNAPPTGRDFYRVTARSTGASGKTNTVLSSTYARRF